MATPPNAFERGGQRRRGYKRGDLEDAAEAIRSGELEVPPEVAACPPQPPRGAPTHI